MSIDYNKMPNEWAGQLYKKSDNLREENYYEENLYGRQ